MEEHQETCFLNDIRTYWLPHICGEHKDQREHPDFISVLNKLRSVGDLQRRFPFRFGSLELLCLSSNVRSVRVLAGNYTVDG